MVGHLDHVGLPDRGIGILFQQRLGLQVRIAQHHDGLAAQGQPQDRGHAVAVPEGEAGDILLLHRVLVGIEDLDVHIRDPDLLACMGLQGLQVRIPFFDQFSQDDDGVLIASQYIVMGEVEHQPFQGDVLMMAAQKLEAAVDVVRVCVGEVPAADADLIFPGDLLQEPPQPRRGLLTPLEVEAAVDHEEAVVAEPEDVEHTAVGGPGGHMIVRVIVEGILEELRLIWPLAAVAEGLRGAAAHILTDPDLAPLGQPPHMVVPPLTVKREEAVVADGMAGSAHGGPVVPEVFFGHIRQDLHPEGLLPTRIPLVLQEASRVIAAGPKDAALRGGAVQKPVLSHRVPRFRRYRPFFAL